LECGNMRQIARGKILVYLFCFIWSGKLFDDRKCVQKEK
jgi:hypothetical protein